MEQGYQVRLQKNWISLQESINCHDVVPYLFQDLVLDIDMVEKIEAEKTTKRKVSVLLTMIHRGGSSTYQSFRRALQKCHVYHHLVEKLDNTVIDCVPVTEDMTDVGNPSSSHSNKGATRSTSLSTSEGLSRPLTLQSVTSDPGPTRKQTVPPIVVRTEFTDSECYDLAELLDDKDFRKLGLKLEFKAAQMSRYQRINLMEGSAAGTYRMVVDWKKGHLDYEQREVLSNALDSAGCVSLARQVRNGQKLEVTSPPPPNVQSTGAANPLRCGRPLPESSESGHPAPPPMDLNLSEPRSLQGALTLLNISDQTRGPDVRQKSSFYQDPHQLKPGE